MRKDTAAGSFEILVSGKWIKGTTVEGGINFDRCTLFLNKVTEPLLLEIGLSLPEPLVGLLIHPSKPNKVTNTATTRQPVP